MHIIPILMISKKCKFQMALDSLSLQLALYQWRILLKYGSKQEEPIKQTDNGYKS